MNMHRVMNYIFIKHAQEPHRVLRNAGLVFAVMCAVIFLVSGADKFNLPDGLNSIYGIGVFILAVVVLGRYTFNEFKNPLTAVGWLTLPASTEEKWLANFITSFLLAPLMYIFLLTLGTAFIKMLLLIPGWNAQFEVFNPVSRESWELLTDYWIIHPILFFGAIYFKKNIILKTWGSVFVLLSFLVAYTAFLGWIIFPELTTHSSNWNGEEFYMEFLDDDHHGGFSPGNWLSPVKTILFYGSFLYFWGLSYLRLREVDV